MADETKTAAQMGDNTGGMTLLTGDALSEHLNEAYKGRLDRLAELEEAGEKYLTIRNDEEDAAATQFMVSVRALWKASEAERVAEKSPFDDNGGIVQAFFMKRILDKLSRAPERKDAKFDPTKRDDLGLGPRINMAQTLYKIEKQEEERRVRAESERKAREEEERRRAAAIEADRLAREAEATASRKRNEETRKAAEEEASRRRAEALAAREAENRAAEARAAAQQQTKTTAADTTRIRGEQGGVSSLATFTNFRDLDRDELDLEKLRSFIDDKALEKAVKGWIDANKGAAQAAAKGGEQPIRGVQIFEDYKNKGRA